MSSKIEKFYEKIKNFLGEDLKKKETLTKLMYDERDNDAVIINKISKIITILSLMKRLTKNLNTEISRQKIKSSNKKYLSRHIRKLDKIARILKENQNDLIKNRFIVMERDKAFEDTQILNDNMKVSKM